MKLVSIYFTASEIFTTEPQLKEPRKSRNPKNSTHLLKEKITVEMEKDNKNIFYNKLAASLVAASTVWFVALLVFIYSNTLQD